MGVIISYCTCSPLAYAAHACLHLFDLSNFYCICVILVTIRVPQLPVHVHVSLVKHCSSYFDKHDLFWLSPSNSDPCHHWLHAHLVQLSGPRSSRADSAHAVYWVRLHPHYFLHPLLFGAATVMWVKVMWLSIVEYLTVDMPLEDFQTAPHLICLDPQITSFQHSSAGRHG